MILLGNICESHTPHVHINIPSCDIYVDILNCEAVYFYYFTKYKNLHLQSEKNQATKVKFSISHFTYFEQFLLISPFKNIALHYNLLSCT